MSDYVSDELIEMAKGLMKVYQDYCKILRPEVASIIQNNIRDIPRLERVLDQLLNVPTDEGYELLVILCDYISSFDKNLADEYLSLYNEFYGDDESTHDRTK